MTDAVSLLKDALRRAEPVTLSIADIGARGLLEALAEDGASYSVRIESLIARVEVEMGNGLVVGARATRDGNTLEGREAYALLRGIKTGTAEVAPKRFLSMANVLEPIGALPDVGGISSLPPPGDPDTIELALPEARPPVPPPPPPPMMTEEIELPPELRVAPPPVSPRRSVSTSLPAPPPAPVSITAPPLRRKAAPVAARPSRRGWAIAAAALVGISGLAAVAVAALGTGGAPVAAPAPIEPVRVVSAPATPAAPEPQLEDEEDDEAGPSEARELAREARQLLRRGRPRAALWRARRAARLRRGVPYYQVVLGDALAANGQEAAARRAWRRALRMRPGYRVAAERLERSRPAS